MTIFEEGKAYKVNHSRKGTFSFKVTEQSEEWVSGVLVSGKARAMLDYNEKFPGDKITVRKSFCEILEKIES